MAALTDEITLAQVELEIEEIEEVIAPGYALGGLR